MLILTKKRGQSVIIGNVGDEIILTIMEVDKSNVRISVDAPLKMSVNHTETRTEKNNESLL